MLRASLNRTMDSLSPGGNPPNLGDVENANVSKARRGSVGENPKPLGSGSGFSLILGALPLAAGCRGDGAPPTVSSKPAAGSLLRTGCRRLA